MKKIFITGGAGFIGSNAAHYFYKKKWEFRKVMLKHQN